MLLKRQKIQYLIQLGACDVDGLDHVVVSCVADPFRVGGKDLGAVEALDSTLLLLPNNLRMSRGKVQVQSSLLAKTLLAGPAGVRPAVVHLPIMPSCPFQGEKPLLLSCRSAALAALKPLLHVFMCCCKVSAQCFRWQDYCFTLWALPWSTSSLSIRFWFIGL